MGAEPDRGGARAGAARLDVRRARSGRFDGLLDVALLDEVLTTVTDAYVRGLRGVAPSDVVRRAVRVTGAARFFWFAPRMVAAAGAAATNNLYSYDTRDVAERFAGREPIFRRLVEWADSI